MIEKFKIMFNRLSILLKKKKKILIVGLVSAVCVIVGVSIWLKSLEPTLKLQLPKEKITSTYKDEIIIPVVLSRLPDDEYPAASVAIKFDNNKLEFIGVKMGTMETYNDYDPDRDKQPSYKIPQWVYNADVANENGEVRAMYLDTTAGKNAYVQEGFEKKTKDIPFKLVFKLKDSVIEDDRLEIDIKEAVFAKVNEEIDKTT